MPSTPREKAQDGAWDDETARATVPTELIGAMLGEFRVEEQIGSGGMGLVYRAVHPVIGKTVAIKVLRKEVSRDPSHVERLLAEARAVNAARHRAIIDIFNFGTLPDGRQYLVMEFLDGRGLDVVLAEKGALPLGQVLAFVRDLASALSAAHDAGVVHRDLKPSNVFVVKQGGVQYVKLLDFGLARQRTGEHAARETVDGLVMGTPEYMAPEQARGEAAIPRSDLYALGVMTFEMLTGRLPFEAKSPIEYLLHHVNTPAPDIRSVRGSIPPELAALIARMLAKKPSDRPASAEEVRLAVKDVLSSTAITARKTGERAAPTGASGEKRRPRVSGEKARRSGEKVPLGAPEEHGYAGGSGIRDPIKPPAVAAKRAKAPAPVTDDALPAMFPRRKGRSRTAHYALMSALVILAGALAWTAAGVVDRMLGPVALPPEPVQRRAVGAEEETREPSARPRPAAKPKGALTLVTTPGSKVRLGRRDLGETPLFSVPLEEGVHLLELTGPDGKARELSVPIVAGETAKFRLRLEELPPAR